MICIGNVKGEQAQPHYLFFFWLMAWRFVSKPTTSACALFSQTVHEQIGYFLAIIPFTREGSICGRETGLIESFHAEKKLQKIKIYTSQRQSNIIGESGKDTI